VPAALAEAAAAVVVVEVVVVVAPVLVSLVVESSLQPMASKTTALPQRSGRTYDCEMRGFMDLSDL
jgi:hypothetical protein